MIVEVFNARKCNDPDCPFPLCKCWDNKARFSQARVRKLEDALLLAKQMMVANDLVLPHTFEVIDDALNIKEARDDG